MDACLPQLVQNGKGFLPLGFILAAQHLEVRNVQSHAAGQDNLFQFLHGLNNAFPLKPLVDDKDLVVFVHHFAQADEFFRAGVDARNINEP